MLKKIWIRRFRNLQENIYEFSPEFNYFIFGQNNQGKTNFLEAIYVLVNGRSPKEKELQNTIPFGKMNSEMGAITVEQAGGLYKTYIQIEADGKKNITWEDPSKIGVRKLQKQVSVEYVSSETIELFQNTPDRRRSDLNQFLSEAFPAYRNYLKQYNQIIRQKNNLLKSEADISSELEIWNIQLVKTAQELVRLRVKGIEEITPVFNRIVGSAYPEWDGKTAIYYHSKFGPIGTDQVEKYSHLLSRCLEENKGKERMSKQSLYGPHRDDYELVIGELAVAKFFSKGMNRFFSILFKAAQLRFLEEKQGRFPLLLLDDVLAEVDFENKRHIFEILSRYTRFFYASVTQKDAELIPLVKQMEMKNGALNEIYFIHS